MALRFIGQTAVSSSYQLMVLVSQSRLFNATGSSITSYSFEHAFGGSEVTASSVLVSSTEAQYLLSSRNLNNNLTFGVRRDGSVRLNSTIEDPLESGLIAFDGNDLLISIDV